MTDVTHEEITAAVAAIRNAGQTRGVTSFVSRKLQCGYNRAARILEVMEQGKVITPADHLGQRTLLDKAENYR